MEELPLMDLGRIVRDVKEIEENIAVYNRERQRKGEAALRYHHSPWYCAIFRELDRIGIPEVVALTEVPRDELRNFSDQSGLYFQIALHTKEFGYEVFDDNFTNKVATMHLPIETGAHGGTITKLPLQKEDFPEDHFPNNLFEKVA